MSVRGGDIREFKVNGRELEIAVQTAATITTGGYNTETNPTGNGNIAQTKTRKLAGFEGLVISTQAETKDFEFLQNIWNDTASVQIVLSLVTGEVYSGSLYPSGELSKSTDTGQVTIAMKGKSFDRIA
ncbi:MAG: hypothetical protein LBF97_02795 [Elusimicrobiota bacterium]|jgi:hypothetical protein|nr:hypothetical protein [Elusimicrobiota bacterium]